MAPAQPRQQRRGPVLAVPQLQPPLLRAAVARLAIEVSTKLRESFHNIRKSPWVFYLRKAFTLKNLTIHYAKMNAFYFRDNQVRGRCHFQ